MHFFSSTCKTVCLVSCTIKALVSCTSSVRCNSGSGLGGHISTEVVYLQRWHGWCHMKLQPSRRKFCVHHTTMLSPCHIMQSHIRKVYACLAVTCYLHFWQNDRGLLRATAVTRGWNGYRNKSQHRKSTLEKKILPPFLNIFRGTHWFCLWCVTGLDLRPLSVTIGIIH